MKCHLRPSGSHPSICKIYFVCLFIGSFVLCICLFYNNNYIYTIFFSVCRSSLCCKSLWITESADSNQVRVHLKCSNKTKFTQVSVWDQFWLSMNWILTISICLSVPTSFKMTLVLDFPAIQGRGRCVCWYACVCMYMHVCLLSHWPWFLSHSWWILPS